ncbi:DNA-methyltransferase [Lactobacillus sp. PSON]|uniref:DNA-methyltransferase n=1 Tax=Lactobacillus sp. PSON TaxID=3455454 RepID=UPI0040427FC0
MNYFYRDKNSVLVLGDTFKCLNELPNSYIDLLIIDPPYFLSNGGFSNRNGKKVSVNKGDWDNPSKINVEKFYNKLIRESYRVLKKDGTLWMFGTYHNIYLAGYLLKKFDFRFLNNVTWVKKNPAENLSKRMLTHSSETIIWAKKNGGRHIFNYNDIVSLNEGHQLTDVWITPTINKKEKKFGYHPTQKPLSLIKRIIQCSATADSIILDPFVGSGTTLVAARALNIRCIGIDQSKKYLKIAKRRLDNLTDNYYDLIE